MTTFWWVLLAWILCGCIVVAALCAFAVHNGIAALEEDQDDARGEELPAVVRSLRNREVR